LRIQARANSVRYAVVAMLKEQLTIGQKIDRLDGSPHRFNFSP
jgi:hypothetical protein